MRLKMRRLFIDIGFLLADGEIDGQVAGLLSLMFVLKCS